MWPRKLNKASPLATSQTYKQKASISNKYWYEAKIQLSNRLVDQCMFLGNCPPTPPQTWHFAQSEKCLCLGRGRRAVFQKHTLIQLAKWSIMRRSILIGSPFCNKDLSAQELFSVIRVLKLSTSTNTLFKQGLFVCLFFYCRKENWFLTQC